jgi:carotenoid cleavage dioxygenase-like enzyme
VIEETDAADLPIEGELPLELDGVYLRNGPNQRFTPLGSYVYPLDGDGMVHGMWLSEGRARYANRFVQTEALRAEEQAGRALWGGLLTGLIPDASEVGPVLAGQPKTLPDINVVRHAGRLLALAEADCPYCLSPTLQTLGRETFDGMLPAGITAHPKVDPPPPAARLARDRSAPARRAARPIRSRRQRGVTADDGPPRRATDRGVGRAAGQPVVRAPRRHPHP